MPKKFEEMNPKERAAFMRNPMVLGTLRAQIAADMKEMQRLADWEVWARAKNPIDLLDAAGRLFFITDHAAKRCGVSMDMPEMRILAGAASALGDIAARPHELEQHRGAIQSGLAACERLWPYLDLFALAEGALAFRDAMAGNGISLHSFNCAKP
jgi:hypothetical protein